MTEGMLRELGADAAVTQKHYQAGIRSYFSFNKLSLCRGLKTLLSLRNPRDS